MSEIKVAPSIRKQLLGWQAKVAGLLLLTAAVGAGANHYYDAASAEDPGAIQDIPMSPDTNAMNEVQRTIMESAHCTMTDMTVQTNGDMLVGLNLEASAAALNERDAAAAQFGQSVTLPYEFRAAIVADDTKASQIDAWLKGTNQAPVTPTQLSAETATVHNGFVIPHPGTIKGNTIVTGVVLKDPTGMEGAPGGRQRTLQCAGALVFDASKDAWTYSDTTPDALDLTITCDEPEDITPLYDGWTVKPIAC